MFQKHVEDDETILTIVHRHWLLGIQALFVPTVIFIITCVITAMATTKGWRITLLTALFIECLWWMRTFLDFYLDAWIITNQGIIDVAWYGWFHRESSRILYSDIQGVAYEMKGIFSTIFQYGTISIEKISTGTAISLEQVSRPKKIETLILNAQERYLHSKNLRDSSQVKDLLSTMIAEQIQFQSLPK